MLIATDPLSLVFVACFLFGLLFFVGTALLGNLGHGHAGHVGNHGVADTGNVHADGHSLHVSSHAHANVQGHVPVNTHGVVSHAPAQVAHQHDTYTLRSSLLSYINPTSIVLFLLGFGFFGYVFHSTAHLALPFTLILAGLGGLLIAAVLLVALSRLFGESEATTVQDVSDRTGLLGKVSTTIKENSLGEIIYTSPGGMRKSIAARSIDGQRIERDQEVVVLNYQNGIAEVDTWEHFISEEEQVHPDGNKTKEDELAKLRALLEESGPANTELAIRNDLQKE
jgi:hypothetical protein